MLRCSETHLVLTMIPEPHRCTSWQQSLTASHQVAKGPYVPPIPHQPHPPTCNLEHLLCHLADDLGARVVVLVDPGRLHWVVMLQSEQRCRAPTRRGAASSQAVKCGSFTHASTVPSPHLWPKPNMRSLRFFTPSRKGPTLSTLPIRCKHTRDWSSPGDARADVQAGSRPSKGAIPPCAPAASHRPPHLQHAQHRLIGAAMQGAIQRAYGACHHCSKGRRNERHKE